MIEKKGIELIAVDVKCSWVKIWGWGSLATEFHSIDPLSLAPILKAPLESAYEIFVSIKGNKDSVWCWKKLAGGQTECSRNR